MALIVLVAATLAACGGGRASPGGAEAPPEVLLPEEARGLLGEDDGFQAAILYSGELMGSIDGCGCFGSPQLGGVPYRVSYARAFRAAYPRAAVLEVDAGHSMVDTHDARGALIGDFSAKDEWVARAFDRFGLDAANLSCEEVPYFEPLLREGAWAAAVAERPALARFVSANVDPAAPGLLAPPRYVVREVEGARAPGGRLRVGFVGLTRDGPGVARSGFRTVDPGEALARVLPEVRSKSDLVVVLAYMDPDEVGRLAERFGREVDAYVVAGPVAHDAEFKGDGPAPMAFASYKSQKLGELRLVVEGGRIARATNRYVKLDAPLPRDEDAARMASDAKEAIKKAQTERFAQGG